MTLKTIAHKIALFLVKDVAVLLLLVALSFAVYLLPNTPNETYSCFEEMWRAESLATAFHFITLMMFYGVLTMVLIAIALILNLVATKYNYRLVTYIAVVTISSAIALPIIKDENKDIDQAPTQLSAYELDIINNICNKLVKLDAGSSISHRINDLSFEEYEVTRKISGFPKVPSKAYHIGYEYIGELLIPDTRIELEYYLPASETVKTMDEQGKGYSIHVVSEQINDSTLRVLHTTTNY